MSADVVSADECTVNLSSPNTGAHITNQTGWTVDGIPADDADWLAGSSAVNIVAAGICIPGATVAYDGSGPMVITPGSVAMV